MKRKQLTIRMALVGWLLGAVYAQASNKTKAKQESAFRCNGFGALCNKRYNQVAYAATHNGHSYKESDVHNQDLPISEQLNRGIRALKFHVWYNVHEKGNPTLYVCHGIDKKVLYDAPLEKIMDQVPFLYKPFARALIDKMEPMKDIILNAFEAAYGRDNAAGLIPFNHCVLDPAACPLELALKDIRVFLDKHPHEVVTLILEDHTNNLALIDAQLKSSGLHTYAHTQPTQAAWPTLQTMIERNKRAVVFVHSNAQLPYASYPALHNLWQFAWDTQWQFKSMQDFKNCAYDCVPHRGKEAFDQRKKVDNKLFVVHHFLTDFVGGNKQHAKKVNKKSIMKPRLERLAQQAGHIPNIIQVDFFEHPNNDIFEVVNELNGVG